MPTTTVLSTEAIFLGSKPHHLFPNGVCGFLSAADLFWIQSCHGRAWVMMCSFALGSMENSHTEAEEVFFGDKDRTERRGRRYP